MSFINIALSSIYWLALLKQDSYDEEYLNVLTRENMEQRHLLKDSDYVIKSVLTDEIKYVSEDAFC